MHNTSQAIVNHLGLSSNAIFLLDHQTNELKLASCNVFSDEDLEKVVMKLGEGAPGKIAQEKKPIYVKNLKYDSDIHEYARKIHIEKSSIGYPLICKEKVLGVIAFDADTIRDFSKREQDLFEHIANQVALAIHNAQLFSQLEHLSVTDGLTGLYNHRFFQNRLSEEIKRTKRKNGNLSLLIIDVDKFKHYNDTFGHLLGDELLKEIARIIEKSVRSFDIVARYGGEEFSVILLDCDKNQAARIAERIRVAIEQFNFYGGYKQPGKRVTVSIGLATFPEVGGQQELFYFSDQALYRAKEKGRNRVETHIKKARH